MFRARLRDSYPGRLSGRERRRVAIAPALVNSPAVLLAGEPTGAADTAAGEEIGRLLRELNAAGQTLVLVTHSPELGKEERRPASSRGRSAAYWEPCIVTNGDSICLVVAAMARPFAPRSSGLAIERPQMRSAIPLATAGSASRWHRRPYVLLPVTGGDLAHSLRVRRFARGNGCNIRRGLAEELLDASWPEEQQHARRVGIHREAVCDSARAVHEGPRAHIDILIAEPEPNLAFKHDEEFVIVAVDMDGDPKPFGPQNSTPANLPPVCSAVALMTKLPPPANEGCASPASGWSTYPPVLLAGSDMSSCSSQTRWVRHDARREFRRFTSHRHGHLLVSPVS